MHLTLIRISAAYRRHSFPAGHRLCSYFWPPTGGWPASMRRRIRHVSSTPRYHINEWLFIILFWDSTLVSPRVVYPRLLSPPIIQNSMSPRLRSQVESCLRRFLPRQWVLDLDPLSLFAPLCDFFPNFFLLCQGFRKRPVLPENNSSSTTPTMRL